MNDRLRTATLAVFLTSSSVHDPAMAQARDPTVAAVCFLVETSAREADLPVSFLTRLIWRESSFRRAALSPAGAQGIAQFMPGTARDQGVADPFDPEEAIPKAAALLAGLRRRFGNLGLAAAAYNAGAARVSDWLAGHAGLPAETQDYVVATAGAPADTFRHDDDGPAAHDTLTCAQTLAGIRAARPEQAATSVLLAPWGVQLTGAFTKAAALQAFRRDQSRFVSLLGGIEPMIIGGRKAGRGFRPFYQVRAPAPTRSTATALCAGILRSGGACTVLRS